MHNVITSFNKAGFDRYGKECVESFLRFWPTNVRLTVFYEGEETDFPMTHGVSWHPIESIPHLMDYMENLRFPIMHGIVGNDFNMHLDARQARKVFMEVHAAQKYGGKVFWLDADTITHAPVPEGLLDQVLPDDKMNCFLGRDGWYHTESGFIGFNMKHPLCGRFMKNYRNVFISGSHFTQPGWNDCYGFDAMRQLYYQQGYQDAFHNLAEGVPEGTMHPFVNTILGKYMDHRKGPRKDSSSTSKDLVEPREEAYWNGK